MSSPTSRSLAYLRKQGYEAQVVERWIPMTRRRLDLFGCVDIVACKEGETLGVQSTSTSNMQARVEKSMAEPRLRVWLLAGNRFVVQGWAKRGKAGARKLWTLKEQEITLEEYDERPR